MPRQKTADRPENDRRVPTESGNEGASLVVNDKVGMDVDSKARPDLASRKCLFPIDEAEVGVPQTKTDQQPPVDQDDDSLYDVDLSRFGHLDNNFSAYQPALK